MKTLFLFLFLVSQYSLGQEISVKFMEKIPLKAEKYMGTDDYGNVYFTKGNIFYKREKDKTYQFNDLQLGDLSSADIINPLKIVLFYKTMNTVVFLDRHLIEIDRIRFNALPRFRNLGFATLAANNSLWIFDTNSQSLEIFNISKTKTTARSQPIVPKVIDQKSNFNFCWLLTEKNLVQYNLYGSLLQKIPHSGFTEFVENNERLVAKNGEKLFLLKKTAENFQLLKLPQIDLENFYLNDENLYIYDGKFIHQFQITP